MDGFLELAHMVKVLWVVKTRGLGHEKHLQIKYHEGKYFVHQFVEQTNPQRWQGKE
jgi:hypothetical protein